MTGEHERKRVATRIVANSGVQVVGLSISFLVSLVTFATVTRYLGPAKYGYYSAAVALLLIPAMISDLGLRATVLRRISRDPELTGEVVSASLTSRTGVALVAFPITLALAFALPLPHGTRMAALVASVGVFLLVLNDGLLSILQAELRMSWAMLANVLGRLLTLGLTVAVLAVGGGLYAVLLAYIAGNLLTLLVDFYGVRGAGLRLFLDLRYCARLLRGSLMVGAAMMMASLYFRIDTVLLASLRPARDVGLYASAYKFLDLSLVVATSVSVSLFPHLTRELAKKKIDTAQVQHMFNVMLAFGAVVAAVAWMDAAHLIELGSGSKFLPASTALRILAPNIMVIFVSGLFSGMLLAGHRERLMLLAGTATFVLNVALNLALIPPYGYNAAAATTVATGAAWTVLLVVCVRRALGIPVSPRFVPQIAVASAATVAVLEFCPGQWLLVDVLGVAVFVAVLAALPGPGRRYVLGMVSPVLRRRRPLAGEVPT